MRPRILIIQPSHYVSKANRTVFKSRRRSVVSLTLPYLAALTPPGWEIRLVDEQLQEIDFESRPTVVALTTWTLHSLRAYDIAREFRQRGVPVILGGPHACFNPEEAAEHCDAVGIGEGEPIWARMLEDARDGRLQKFYRAPVVEDLSGLPRPRYDLLDLRKYGLFRTFAVMGSRGCPFHCDYCSERLYLGGKYRCRPVQEVIAELKVCPSRQVLFGDSNFGGKRSHAMELMEAMIPLKLRWSALSSAYLCNDVEFLDLAKRSGVLHLNLGIESIDGETLKGMKKEFNQVAKYAEMFRNLRQRGISYSLNFIFGWDTETSSVFQSTLDFLQQHQVPAAYFNVLTPEKGTALFERLQREGRILNQEDIGRWPGQICHLQPKHCTPRELEQQVQRMYREFYSLKSIFSRLPWPVTQANIASWVVNFSQRKMAKASAEGAEFVDF